MDNQDFCINNIKFSFLKLTMGLVMSSQIDVDNELEAYFKEKKIKGEEAKGFFKTAFFMFGLLNNKSDFEGREGFINVLLKFTPEQFAQLTYQFNLVTSGKHYSKIINKLSNDKKKNQRLKITQAIVGSLIVFFCGIGLIQSLSFVLGE